jgi:hypothetical protein
MERMATNPSTIQPARNNSFDSAATESSREPVFVCIGKANHSTMLQECGRLYSPLEYDGLYSHLPDYSADSSQRRRFLGIDPRQNLEVALLQACNDSGERERAPEDQ